MGDLQDTKRQNSPQSHLNSPVHLHVPQHGNRQQRKDNISQNGDARVEEGGEFEVGWLHAFSFRDTAPREGQGLTLEEDGH